MLQRRFEELPVVVPHVPERTDDAHTESPFVISDERTREILTRLGTILHGEIAQASTFFMHGGGYHHLNTIPMEDIELEGWRSVYKLDEVMERAIARTKLYTVDIDAAYGELSDGSHDDALAIPGAPEERPFTGYKHFPPRGTVRVNYGHSPNRNDDIHWVPRELVTPVDSTDGLTYHLRPQIHFGGQSYVRNSLYNAFVSVDAVVEAPNGIQLVSNVYGPESSASDPVYNPDRVLSTSMWMNTNVIAGQPSTLTLRDSEIERVLLSAELHDIESIGQLELPVDDKVKMWFWQLDRLMRSDALALPPAHPELDSAEVVN